MKHWRDSGDMSSPTTPDPAQLLLLSASDVRHQLYREEPKLARIPPWAAELVTKTSLLLVKDLVERALATPGDDDDSARMITRDRVQEAIREVGAYSFASNAVQEVTEGSVVKEYKPKSKPTTRKRPNSSKAARAAKKASKGMTQTEFLDNELDEPTTTTSDTIEVDDDDYD